MCPTQAPEGTTCKCGKTAGQVSGWAKSKLEVDVLLCPPYAGKEVRVRMTH